MSHWCQSLYESHAPQILLYGRALGLSHSEAEDVLQETFVALMQKDEAPEEPKHYCLRSFRNRALNYKRGLWRRLTRELESHRWFERADGELLELSPNTAAGRYRYGLQKLRACLNGENYESMESTGEPTAFLDAPRTVAEP